MTRRKEYRRYSDDFKLKAVKLSQLLGAILEYNMGRKRVSVCRYSLSSKQHRVRLVLRIPPASPALQV